jgi:hypothetical protein
MPIMAQPKDKNGRDVTVGSRVRVLAIKQSILDRLPDEEVEHVRAIVGEILEVYEIDEYGSPWVKKWWSVSEEQSFSHSFVLRPSDMELVDTQRSNLSLSRTRGTAPRAG